MKNTAFGTVVQSSGHTAQSSADLEIAEGPGSRGKCGIQNLADELVHRDQHENYLLWECLRSCC